MTYEFVSEAQLMFKVMIFTGRQMQIHFSQRDGNGMSTYMTSDDQLANAIMSHSFFRTGRIQLSNQIQEQQSQTISKSVVEADTAEPETTVEQSEDPGTELPTEGTELTFPNITIAKDFLHRTYGVKKEEIRSMTKIIAFAESKGITIKFSDPE